MSPLPPEPLRLRPARARGPGMTASVAASTSSCAQIKANVRECLLPTTARTMAHACERAAWAGACRPPLQQACQRAWAHALTAITPHDLQLHWGIIKVLFRTSTQSRLRQNRSDDGQELRRPSNPGLRLCRQSSLQRGPHLGQGAARDALDGAGEPLGLELGEPLLEFEERVHRALRALRVEALQHRLQLLGNLILHGKGISIVVPMSATYSCRQRVLATSSMDGKGPGTCERSDWDAGCERALRADVVGSKPPADPATSHLMPAHLC